jgi:hypothetical protein
VVPDFGVPKLTAGGVALSVLPYLLGAVLLGWLWWRQKRWRFHRRFAGIGRRLAFADG